MYDPTSEIDYKPAPMSARQKEIHKMLLQELERHRLSEGRSSSPANLGVVNAGAATLRKLARRM